jgi:transcriptional regulator with XRE-family HTH domain
LGKLVRLRRIEQKLSQSELGDLLGVSFQQVQKYEKGINRIGASRLQQIADALEVPVTFFYPDKKLTKAESTIIALASRPGMQKLMLASAGISETDLRHLVGVANSMRKKQA